ncbi:MAG: putative acyl-CoA synthetase, long-chain fatty acid:CoA ligase [Pseudonocardiales bacterium]|nr:putative acyl-CoA synthetase, long-chain fatty acid:CoA ligase [Pseudonocardiales bacterium]
MTGASATGSATGSAGRSATWSAQVRAWESADRPALVVGHDTWSWPELIDRAGGAAGLLRSARLPLDVPVPALIHHPGIGLALTLGGAAARRPLAPLGPRLTAVELAACVARLDAPVLLCAPEYFELAEEVARICGCSVLPVATLPSGVLPPSSDDGAVVTVLHTSGTSGLPKAVPFTEARLAARVRVFSSMSDLGPGDTYLTASGFHHIAGGGNLAVGLALGATVASFDRFTTSAWTDLRPAAITHALVVPSMIHSLIADGELGAHPGLRQLFYGGGPIRLETLQAAMELLPGVEMVQMFGQTEGSPVAVLSGRDHERARTGRADLLVSAGRAAPGVELRVDQPAEDGVGEVWGRGAHFAIVDEAGWRRTGDLGRLDEEGYLFLVGRAGDTINRGGENVRPAEVESVLRSFAEIEDVAVVGLPDERLGEVVGAFVLSSDPGTLPDWNDLRARARSELAGFKVPTVWQAVEELPRNAAGKILRRVLRESWVGR